MNRAVLGSALVVTLAATAWLALQPEDALPPAQPARAAARPPVAAAAATPPPMPPARQRPWASPSPDTLAAWGAPVAPVAAAAPPPPALPAPAAPAFPYEWIGRLQDGADDVALLSGPQRSFGVRRGDVLDGRWRVDQIAAARLELTWLPSGDAVSLPAR